MAEQKARLELAFGPTELDDTTLVSFDLNGNTSNFISDTENAAGDVVASEIYPKILPFLGGNYSSSLLVNVITIEAVFFDDIFNFGLVDWIGGVVTIVEQLDNINPQTPTPTLTIVNNICFGQAIGSITIETIIGDFPPFHVAFTDNAGIIDPLFISVTFPFDPIVYGNLPAGSYNLQITDIFNQQNLAFNQDIEITEPDKIIVQGLIDDGNITLTVTGGAGEPYNYDWLDLPGFDNIKNRFGLPIGVYTVIVQDSNGCAGSAVFEITEQLILFTKNPITQTATADPVSNQSFQLDIFIEETYLSNNYELIASMKQNAFAGSTEFNMESVLKSYATHTLPAFKQDAITLAANNFKRFYTNAIELVNGIEDSQIQVNPNIAYYGGLSFIEFAKGNFFNFFKLQKPFLTWKNRSQDTYKEQHQYLFFPSQTNAEAANVIIDITLTNGNELQISPLNIVGLKEFEIYIIPAGYAQLNMSQFGDVKSYTIYIKDNFDNVISEKYTFNVFPMQPDNYVNLIYTNDLGGIDSIACTGFEKRIASMSQLSFERNLKPTYEVRDGTFNTQEKFVTESIKLSLNYKNPDEVKDARSFIYAEKIFIVDQDAGNYIPIRIKQKSFEYINTFKNNYALNFEADILKQQSQTPKL